MVLMPGQVPIFAVEPYPDSFGPVLEAYEKDERFAVAEFADSKETVQFIRQLQNGLLLGHIDSTRTLINYVGLLKILKPLIKKGGLRIILTASIKDQASLTRLQKAGVHDISMEPIAPKTLEFKCRRHLDVIKKHIDAKEKKTNDKRGMKNYDKKGKGGRDQKRGGELKLVAPLTLISDYWLMRGGGAKQVIGRWMITLTGPGPAAGRWVEVEGQRNAAGERLWRFDVNKDWEMTFAMEDGKWFARGNKPDFRGKNWQFVGKKPEIYFETEIEGEKELHRKAYFTDANLCLAKDSTTALRFLPQIEKSLEVQVKVEKEKKKDEQEDDSDLESHMHSDNKGYGDGSNRPGNKQKKFEGYGKKEKKKDDRAEDDDEDDAHLSPEEKKKKAAMRAEKLGLEKKKGKDLEGTFEKEERKGKELEAEQEGAKEGKGLDGKFKKDERKGKELEAEQEGAKEGKDLDGKFKKDERKGKELEAEQEGAKEGKGLDGKFKKDERKGKELEAEQEGAKEGRGLDGSFEKEKEREGKDGKFEKEKEKEGKDGKFGEERNDKDWGKGKDKEAEKRKGEDKRGKSDDDRDLEAALDGEEKKGGFGKKPGKEEDKERGGRNEQGKETERERKEREQQEKEEKEGKKGGFEKKDGSPAERKERERKDAAKKDRQRKGAEFQEKLKKRMDQLKGKRKQQGKESNEGARKGLQRAQEKVKKKKIDPDLDQKKQKERENKGFSPSHSPLALAFLLSELMRVPRKSIEDVCKGFCKYLKESIGGKLGIELWYKSESEWICVATDSGQPGEQLEAVKSFEEESKAQEDKDLSQLSTKVVSSELVLGDCNELGVIAIVGRGADEVDAKFVEAVSEVTDGVLTSLVEGKAKKEAA